MQRLDRFFEVERRYVPKSRYTYKDESWVMGLAGVLIWPFNPKFMDNFTTTLGACTYFPRTYREVGMEDSALMIEFHEFVHKWDSKQHPIKFSLGYIFSWNYRRDVELRGYTMSMYVQWLRWRREVNSTDYLRHFTSSEYLWMERNADYVEKELDSRQCMFVEYEDKFLDPPDMLPYRVVRDFLKSEGMLHASLC